MVIKFEIFREIRNRKKTWPPRSKIHIKNPKALHWSLRKHIGKMVLFLGFMIILLIALLVLLYLRILEDRRVKINRREIPGKVSVPFIVTIKGDCLLACRMGLIVEHLHWELTAIVLNQIEIICRDLLTLTHFHLLTSLICWSCFQIHVQFSREISVLAWTQPKSHGIFTAFISKIHSSYNRRDFHIKLPKPNFSSHTSNAIMSDFKCNFIFLYSKFTVHVACHNRVRFFANDSNLMCLIYFNFISSLTLPLSLSLSFCFFSESKLGGCINRCKHTIR